MILRLSALYLELVHHPCKESYTESVFRFQYQFVTVVTSTEERIQSEEAHLPCVSDSSLNFEAKMSHSLV